MCPYTLYGMENVSIVRSPTVQRLQCGKRAAAVEQHLTQVIYQANCHACAPDYRRPFLCASEGAMP